MNEAEYQARIVEILARTLLLLKNIGNPGTCKGCGRQIWWVTHNSGKVVPYTPEGLNHFIDCPSANQFRKKKEEKG